MRPIISTKQYFHLLIDKQYNSWKKNFYFSKTVAYGIVLEVLFASGGVLKKKW